MVGSIWERFTHDPRHEEHARLRASDSDRDIVNDVLGTAYAEGRLTPEELDERQHQEALFSFITPTLICWVIWSATMFGGFPWPLFVMIASGLNYLRVVTGREDAIASIERDLEKKERKRLEEKQRKENKALPPAKADSDRPGDDPQVNQG